jgi:CubicO group peptidase (beta-lactamase class C family)
MPNALPKTTAIIEQGRVDGLHIGAQLYVSGGGEEVVNLALGESRPGVAMTTDTLMLWLSSTKPIAAVAILQLVERGLLALDDRVSRHIPEFGQNGKEPITVRQLLTHTGGFRLVDTGWPDTTDAEIVQRICRAKLERDWIPGQRAGYHPYSSWYILAELVRRLAGRAFRDYVREAIFLPIGMRDSWIGMPAEQYRAYGERIGLLVNTEKPGLSVHPWSTEAGAVHGPPGAGGYGPMRELGRFYEMLLGEGELSGVRILSAASVRAMTSRQRIGIYDETFKHTMDWGLGMIIDSKQYGADTVPYGYGRYASPRAFGHSGNQSSAAFADPEHQLVLALVFNGMCGEVKHQRRVRAVLDSLYDELGIAGGNGG